MILSPTNRLGDWAEAAGAEENMVSYTFVRDVVCPQLRKEGFAVPARQLLVRTLEPALSLMHYIEHNQVFPSHDNMLPNLEAESLEHKLALENLVNADEVALGWRHLQTQYQGECETTSTSMCTKP
jgi:hypothetical protein